MTYFAEIAVSCPLRQCFDYRIPETMILSAGMRVKVSFGRRFVTGIVVHVKSSTTLNIETKYILEKLDEEPILSTELLQLAIWASQYYHHPIGEVLNSMLPKRLKQGKTLNIQASKNEKNNNDAVIVKSAIQLNQEQTQAVEFIIQKSHEFHTFLLHGITGSGKTEVYFAAIEEVLKKNQQILFLIPEISLSPQTLARFQQRFSKIAVIHSALSDKERLTTWNHACTGDAKIIIGTRSAIFMPFHDLGLIVIDEEHDPSFKQQTGFRYSARDLAIKRAQHLNIPIILGSATPSIESYYHALNNKYHLLSLTGRALDAKIPELRLIATPRHLSSHIFAEETLKIMQEHLSRQEQVLIFINRRGYAPTWLCQNCAWQANCSRCDSHLVLHKKDKKLICHHCGHQTTLNKTCPQCHSHSLLAIGEGTQRIAETLSTLFVDIPILRIDRDNIKNPSQLEEHLNSAHRQEAAILVGTQILAKGHHFPNVTLALILGIDSGLMSNDFHALESTAQLIVQVAGRAGRADKPGLVLLQTLDTEHPQLHLLQQHNYGLFLQALLKERQIFQLPPFSYLALFRVEAKQKEAAWQSIINIQALAHQLIDPHVTIYDPVPAPIQRKAGFYHFQLLIKSSQRLKLHGFLNRLLNEHVSHKIFKGARFSLEIDPIHLG